MMADKPGACEQAVFLGIVRGQIWRDVEQQASKVLRCMVSSLGAGGEYDSYIIKQMYTGHAQQAAMVSAGSGGGFYCKWYYVVDEDINQTD